MYVWYYYSVVTEGFRVTTNFDALELIFRISECCWMIPGTINPMED